MLLKNESGCLGEVIGRLRGGLELFEQGHRLTAHSLLHNWQLMQPRPAEDGLEPNAGGGNSTLPAGAEARPATLDESGGRPEPESARLLGPRTHPDAPVHPDDGSEK